MTPRPSSSYRAARRNAYFGKLNKGVISHASVSREEAGSQRSRSRLQGEAASSLHLRSNEPDGRDAGEQDYCEGPGNAEEA